MFQPVWNIITMIKLEASGYIENDVGRKVDSRIASEVAVFKGGP